MAPRRRPGAAAALAAALVAVRGAVAQVGVCEHVSGYMMSAIIGISPDCFRLCPKLCDHMDLLVARYTDNYNKSVVKPFICANPQPFACLYKKAHELVCDVVIKASSGYGIDIPSTAEALDLECAVGDGGRGSGGGGGATGGKFKDLPAEDLEESEAGDENDTDLANDTDDVSNATVTTTAAASQGEVSSLAAGSFVPILASVAPIAASIAIGRIAS